MMAYSKKFIISVLFTASLFGMENNKYAYTETLHRAVLTHRNNSHAHTTTTPSAIGIQRTNEFLGETLQESPQKTIPTYTNVTQEETNQADHSSDLFFEKK